MTSKIDPGFERPDLHCWLCVDFYFSAFFIGITYEKSFLISYSGYTIL